MSYIFMEKDGLNGIRGHAIIGFNHGLPTALVFVYLSPSGHVFNIAWQAMIKTYNQWQNNLIKISDNLV